MRSYLSLTAAILAFVFLLPCKSFSDEIPGKSLANNQVRTNVWKRLKLFILILDSGTATCNDPEVVDTRVHDPPPKGTKKRKGMPVKGTWTEIWRVDQCGTSWDYKVEFTADGKGNISARTSPWGGGQNIIDCILPDGSKVATMPAACKQSGGRAIP